jgi:hypothetical protein
MTPDDIMWQARQPRADNIEAGYRSMNIKLIAVTLLMPLMLISCKVVNTHAFKITSSPELGATEVRIATTKGHLHLSTEQMSDTQRELLKGMLPFQCLAVGAPHQRFRDELRMR